MIHGRFLGMISGNLDEGTEKLIKTPRSRTFPPRNGLGPDGFSRRTGRKLIRANRATSRPHPNVTPSADLRHEDFDRIRKLSPTEARASLDTQQHFKGWTL
jgi:hypothetical protein